MKVQAGRVRHADGFVVIRIVFNLKSFGFDLRFGIIPLHMLFIKKKTRSVGSLAPSKCLRKLKCTIVAILRHIQFV